MPWQEFVSKSFQEKQGDDELARKGCGTGAFRYKNWIVDEKVVLERFPDYWKKGIDGKPLPYLDGMEEHYRPKIDQAVLDLRSGGLDTVHFPPPREVSKIKESPDLLYSSCPPSSTMTSAAGSTRARDPSPALNCAVPALCNRPGTLCQDHRFRRLPSPSVPLHRGRAARLVAQGLA